MDEAVEDSPIALTVASDCGGLAVEARAKSRFRRVRLAVGGDIVRSGYGRVRWRGAPPDRELGEGKLTVVATAGTHEAEWVAEHASPVQVSVSIAADAVAYAPVVVTVSAEAGCPAALDDQLVAKATSPWHVATAQLDGATTETSTAVAWGPTLAVDWTVAWNGWIVDHGRVEAPLALPRFDLDGDQLSVREGDADDHDAAIGAVPVPPADATAVAAVNTAPWGAIPLVAGAGPVAVSIGLGEERWYAIDVTTAGPLGALPLRVTADGAIWAEVWDGGPIAEAHPVGRLASLTPMVYIPVGPGRELAPQGADTWRFVMRAGDHPPFLTDDLWKAAMKPTKNPLWGLVKIAGAAIVTTVTAAIDAASAVPALLDGQWGLVPAWSGPALAANTRIYLRVTPADASVTARAVTITLDAR